MVDKDMPKVTDATAKPAKVRVTITQEQKAVLDLIALADETNAGIILPPRVKNVPTDTPWYIRTTASLVNTQASKADVTMQTEEWTREQLLMARLAAAAQESNAGFCLHPKPAEGQTPRWVYAIPDGLEHHIGE